MFSLGTMKKKLLLRGVVWLAGQALCLRLGIFSVFGLLLMHVSIMAADSTTNFGNVQET